MPETQEVQKWVEAPEVVEIKGQAAVKIESPFPDWPGHIFVPRALSPAQFDQWWKSRPKADDDSSPAMLQLWRERAFLVLEWHIVGLEPHHIDETGMNLPSMEIVRLVVAATQKLIEEASGLPNLPGWWSNELSGRRPGR